MEKKFAILGIHKGLETFDENGVVVNIRNVARVRIFLEGKIIDEDFKLPDLLPGVPDTEQVYEQFLMNDINKRIEELSANMLDCSQSEVQSVTEFGDSQIITEVSNE